MKLSKTLLPAVLITLAAGSLAFSAPATDTTASSFQNSKSPSWKDKIKISGDIRGRVEGVNNQDYSSDKDDSDQKLLTRIRVMMEADFCPNFKAVARVIDAREFFSEIHPNTNEDALDLSLGYVDIKAPKDIPLSLRIGRQELVYGDKRILANSEWSNYGRSFDAVKLSWKGEDKWIDLFWGNVVKAERYTFDDSDKNTHLAGLYGSITPQKSLTADAYLLYKYTDAEETKGEDGKTGSQDIYTIGSRVKGKLNAWDYNGEIAGQLGKYGTDDVRAWALALAGGYTFDYEVKPRVGMELNHGSGDSDPTDGKHESFDILYPANHYKYGYSDFFSLKNMTDLRLMASCQPTNQWQVTGDVHFFWLDTVKDAWYDCRGKTIRKDSTGTADNFVGEEVNLLVNYTLNKNWKFETGYAHFFAGPYVKDTGASDDSDYGWFQTSYLF
jgi:hypothetical protein